MPVDQVTSTAGSATGLPLSGMTGMLQGGVNTLINKGSNILDNILPPERRQDLQSKLAKFATEKPYLASFLLSQIAISGFPLFLFVTMTITVSVFALLAGLLVGLLGAILFILGAVGFALVILLPTLFITTFAAVGIWLWGMGAYYIIKKFNKKEVPGIHVLPADGLQGAPGISDVKSALMGSEPKETSPKYDEKKNEKIQKSRIDKPAQNEKKKSDQSTQQVTDGVKQATNQVPLDQVTNQVPENPVTKNPAVSNATKSLGLG